VIGSAHPEIRLALGLIDQHIVSNLDFSPKLFLFVVLGWIQDAHVEKCRAGLDVELFPGDAV